MHGKLHNQCHPLAYVEFMTFQEIVLEQLTITLHDGAKMQRSKETIHITRCFDPSNTQISILGGK
jgi:hypothetical protein